MICPECKYSNPAGAAICKGCGARMMIKQPPSMITVNLSKQDESDSDDYEPRPAVSRGVIIGLISAGVVVVAALILAVVLLADHQDKQASAPANAQTVIQTPTQKPDKTPEPTQTPVHTTAPDTDDEDYSSLFETP